jgi:resuscitation-promoting factor RpfB
LTARGALVSFAGSRTAAAECGRPDREADPISEQLTRRSARTNGVDARARRYALRVVRPSPARLEAPEPDVWLPILDLTEELETLDITGELELLALEEGRVDLERELAELEADFWRTAEAEHPFLTGETPAVLVAPVVAGAVVAGAAVPPSEAAAVTGEPIIAVEPKLVPAPEPLPIPDAYAALRPNRPAIAQRRRALRLRRRLIVTALVVAVTAACVGVTAQVIGGTHPRRDVTVSVDGQANTIVTRAGTVGDLLAARGVVIHDGDRVVPALSTQLRQGMPIHISRAFPIVLDVDGVVTHHRTTNHDLRRLRRELRLSKSLVAIGAAGRLTHGSHIMLRTPHDVIVVADGVATPVARVTALTVGELMASRHLTLGPTDELTPAAGSHLTRGMTVRIFRVAPDEVIENKVVPFSIQYRDDPTLARGHLATIQAGKNGTARVVSKVVRKDGTIVQWGPVVSSTVVVSPVTEILARGTKVSGKQQAPPLPALGGQPIGDGYATWYQSNAGPGTCAHRTLPFGTIVTLVADNGRTAQCRVADRGPEAWTGNVIDLNPDVFAQLGPLGTGRIHVKMLSAS